MPPTKSDERLDRVERAIAQLVSADRAGFGWRPEHNNQPELAAIRDEQFEKIQREKVTTV